MADRIAHILKERRTELHMTQIQVAMESVIALQQYQRFEKGIRPLENCSFRIGLRIFATLELDPYDIFPYMDT